MGEQMIKVTSIFSQTLWGFESPLRYEAGKGTEEQSNPTGKWCPARQATNSAAISLSFPPGTLRTP